MDRAPFDFGRTALYQKANSAMKEDSSESVSGSLSELGFFNNPITDSDCDTDTDQVHR